LSTFAHKLEQLIRIQNEIISARTAQTAATTAASAPATSAVLASSIADRETYLGPWSMLANELLFERSHSHKIRVCAAAGDFLENGGAAFVSASALPRLCASAGHAQQLFMAVSEAADYTCPVRALFRFLNNPRHAQTGVPLLAPVTDTLIWSAGLPWVREKELLSLFGAQRTQHPDAMLKSLQCNAKAPQLSRAFYDLEPTLLRFCAELRKANAFEPGNRTVLANMQGDLLVLGVEQLFSKGLERMRTFVRERYIDGKVAVHAPRPSKDTQRIEVAAEGTGSKHVISGARAGKRQNSTKSSAAVDGKSEKQERKASSKGKSKATPKSKGKAKPKGKSKSKSKGKRKKKDSDEEDSADSAGGSEMDVASEQENSDFLLASAISDLEDEEEIE
jgi:hypothetical protein